jgi:hypothetical protein
MKHSRRNPPKRHTFSEKWIDHLPIPESGRVHYYDALTPGLGLRVENIGPNGKKSFFWHRKTGNNSATFKMLGIHGSTTLKEAKGAAQERNGILSAWIRNERESANPFDRSNSKLTLYDAVEDYIERKILPRREKRPDKGARSAKMIRYLRDHYVGFWAKRPLISIRRRELVNLHLDMQSEFGGHVANRTVQMLRATYNWSMRTERYAGDNPAAGIELHPEDSRERRLDQVLT